MKTSPLMLAPSPSITASRSVFNGLGLGRWPEATSQRQEKNLGKRVG